MKLIKEILNILKQLLHMHKFSRDVLHGTIQFTVILYIFSGVIYLIAPYTADFMRSADYYQGALEIAPVVLAAGVISALLCDLVLRKIKPEEKPSDQDKND